MTLKQGAAATAILLTVIAAGAIGYAAGTRSERAQWQPTIAESQMSSALTSIRFNIAMLTKMRQKEYLDTVKDMEHWTIIKLQHVEPAMFVKGGIAERLYPETLEMVNAYRKQFPDTEIDPQKNPTIAKALAR